MWRPSRHSMMKSLGFYFDQVAREQMTERIAARVAIVQGGTATDQPVGADRMLWVDTLHPVSHELSVTWAVDGRTLVDVGDDRALDLGALRLSRGTHRLTARVSDRATRETVSHTWTVDATRPDVEHSLSEPLLTLTRPGRPTQYVHNGPFTMGLTGTDDGAGQVTSEFRLDGDGGHNYYGWPTDARSPFLFTATGTDVDGLVYGNLGSGGLSVSPFAERSPGYGRHTIEYRGIDAVGNIGAARAFVATLIPPPPDCTRVISGRYAGPLVVAATAVELLNTGVRGAVTLTGTTDHVTVVGVHGSRVRWC